MTDAELKALLRPHVTRIAAALRAQSPPKTFAAGSADPPRPAFGRDDVARLSDYFTADEKGYYPANLHRKFGLGQREFADAAQMRRVHAVGADGKGVLYWSKRGAEPKQFAADADEPATPLPPEASDLAAALEYVEQCRADGEDPTVGLNALHDLFLSDDHEVMTFAAWDESKHPRGKDGRYISRDSIQEAKSDPKKAAALRERVRPEDKAKLDDALSGKTDVGRTKKGQAKRDTAQKRESVKASRDEAKRLAYKLQHDPSPEDFHALVPHLDKLSARELSHVRLMLGASFGGSRQVAERRRRLVEYARTAAFDARLEEQGITGEAADDMRRAAGITVKEKAPEGEPKKGKTEKEWDTREAARELGISHWARGNIEELKTAVAAARSGSPAPEVNAPVPQDELRRSVIKADGSFDRDAVAVAAQQGRHPFPVVKRGFDENVIKDAAKSAPVQEVRPDDLHATQPDIDAENFNRIASGSAPATERHGNDPVIVREPSGRLVVADGHHRATLAASRGDALRGRVVDVDAAGRPISAEGSAPKPKRLPTLDPHESQHTHETIDMNKYSTRTAAEAVARGVEGGAVTKIGNKWLALKPHNRQTEPEPETAAPGSGSISGLNDADFAKAVQSAADAHDRGFGNNKVFISDVYDKLKQQDPSLSEDDFKRRLMGANADRRLDLSRADLVQVMHPDDVRRSEVQHPHANASWHFIQAERKDRHNRGPEDRPLPGTAEPVRTGVDAIRHAARGTSDRTRDYLESALHNARPGDERDAAEQLAANYAQAHKAGHMESAQAIADQLHHVGAKLHGTEGEERPFDGRYFKSPDTMFTHDKSVVHRPAVVHTDAEGRETVSSKGLAKIPKIAKVEKPKARRNVDVGAVANQLKDIQTRSDDQSVPARSFRDEAEKVVAGLSQGDLNRIWESLGGVGKLNAKTAAEKIVSSILAARTAYDRSRI